MKLVFGDTSSKSAFAAEARDRRRVDAAKAALRARIAQGLPVANQCPTKGCTLAAWSHTDNFPCSPGLLWVPALRSVHAADALRRAMLELEAK